MIKELTLPKLELPMKYSVAIDVSTATPMEMIATAQATIPQILGNIYG